MKLFTQHSKIDARSWGDAANQTLELLLSIDHIG